MIQKPPPTISRIKAPSPNTTGFHRMAAGSMANRAWNAYTNVTLNGGMEPEELERLWADASEAAESAASLLMAYSTTLARPTVTAVPDVS